VWPSTRPAAEEPLKPSARLTAAEVSTHELGFDDALFEKLKRHRNTLAQAEGVPAYVVFSNQTLEFLTRLKPTSVDAALKIRGVGEKKARTYLPEFIQLIKKHG
jgi:ATP-dependent DNA helicase RecQ